MPSGSKKRRSAKKTKQDAPLLTNGKPDESQAESEEILLNQVDPLEDNEEGPLTPKTPERENESDSIGRGGMPTDEWFKASDQDLGIPTSHAEADFGSEENDLASASISLLDRESITISDRPDDNGYLPNSSVDSIREYNAKNPRVHEYSDSFQFGDCTELDSSLENRDLVDHAESLSTECDLTEPIAETSVETLADLEYVGQQGVVDSEYADTTSIEAPADGNLLAFGSQEETSQDALGETSIELQKEFQQEISGLDVVNLSPPSKDISVEFNSQEETSARAVEAAEEPSKDLELEGQGGRLAGLDATLLSVPVDESVESRYQNETCAAGVEMRGETRADLEVEGQLRVAHLDTSPLTMTADESSVESKCQEETSTAAGDALGETGADLGLEGQQEIVALDATVIPVPAEDDPVESSSREESFTGAREAPGGEETSAAAFEAARQMSTDLELEDQQDATSISVSSDENAAEQKSQEEMSGVVEAQRESSSELELEGQQEAVALDTTPLTLPALENSSESTLQDETSTAMMKSSETSSEGNELEVQQETMVVEATPLTVLTDESCVELMSTAVEVPGEASAEVLEDPQGVSKLRATPGTIPTDESSVELNLQEETSAAAAEEAPGDSRADFESEGQREVSELDDTSLVVPEDESSVELKSQEETSAMATEAPGETSAGFEFECQQDVSELEATPPAFPTDEGFVESKLQLEASVAGMEGEGEGDPLEVWKQDDARPITVLSDESSLELESQETSVTAVESPEETGAKLGSEGELQVLEPDVIAFTVPTSDSLRELESQDETSATAVEAVGKTGSDLEVNPQQVLELDATPLTVSTYESSVESKPQEETSGKTSSDLELDGQLEVLEADARVESKSQEDTLMTAVEASGKTSSDLEMNGRPEFSELDREETSATKVDAPREINADLDLEGQLEVLMTDATPLTLLADESSVESKSQEETSVVAGEAPRETSVDTELKGEQEVLELDATALAVPADETLVELMRASADKSSAELISKRETSPGTVDSVREMTADFELEDQQEVSELDATPFTVPADESSEELKSQRETSAGALDGLREIGAGRLELQGQGEVSDLDATPITVPADERSVESKSQEEASAAVESLEVTIVDCELEGQQEVVEPDAAPLTVHTEESSVELKSQKEISIRTEGETGADFETLDQHEIMEVDDADGIRQGVLAEESQVDQVLRGQGETRTEVMQNGTSEDFQLVGTQEVLDDSDATGLALLPELSRGESNSQGDSCSRAVGEIPGADSKELSYENFDVRLFVHAEKRQINEVLGNQGKTSAGNSEETDSVHSQEVSQTPVPVFKADRSVEPGMFGEVLPDKAEVAHSHKERQAPVMASKADGNDEQVNFGESERRDEAVNGTHDPEEQARQLDSKGVTLPGEQRLESSGMLEDTRGGVAAEELSVRKEEVIARTRELDVGQEKQPVVRQQIQKTKWWECCGVFDVLLGRS